METRAPQMLKPALIGGLLFGALSGVQFLNLLNCLCCVLVIASGFTAAYLYSNASSAANVRFGVSEGALIGLIAGAFFAVGQTAVGIVFQMLFGSVDILWFLDRMENLPNIPPEVLDQMDGIREALEQGGIELFATTIGFFGAVIKGAVFSTLGGLLGGAVFKFEPAPPAPPSAGDDAPTV